jgi:hypothetical protein
LVVQTYAKLASTPKTSSELHHEERDLVGVLVLSQSIFFTISILKNTAFIIEIFSGNPDLIFPLISGNELQSTHIE